MDPPRVPSEAGTPRPRSGASRLGARSLSTCNPSFTRGPALPPSSRELRFYRRLAESVIQCQICFRNCVIPPRAFGDCRNVKNLGGRAYNLVHPLPCALEVDPIEKEPAFHMLPGTTIFCAATAGCRAVSFTYNDPIAFYDFTLDILTVHTLQAEDTLPRGTLPNAFPDGTHRAGDSILRSHYSHL